MKYPSAFHLMSDISKNAGIDCVLIGGFAVNYHKVTRQTVDVDFLITEEDFGKISALLEEAGYRRDYSQKVFTRLSGTGAHLIDIDFMFVDEDTLAKIIKDGKRMSIAGQEFVVPSLNNLIALKLHSLKHNLKIRETKDLPDVIELVRVNKIDFKSDEFRELCLKYGTDEIYNTILKRM